MVDVHDEVEVRDAIKLLELIRDGALTSVLEPAPRVNGNALEQIQPATAPVALYGRDAQPEPPPARPAEPKAAANGATADDIAKAMRAFVNEVGLVKGAELVKKFGVSRASELKPEQYPAFLEEIARAKTGSTQGSK